MKSIYLLGAALMSASLAFGQGSTNSGTAPPGTIGGTATGTVSAGTSGIGTTPGTAATVGPTGGTVGGNVTAGTTGAPATGVNRSGVVTGTTGAALVGTPPARVPNPPSVSAATPSIVTPGGVDPAATGNKIDPTNSNLNVVSTPASGPLGAATRIDTRPAITGQTGVAGSVITPSAAPTRAATEGDRPGVRGSVRITPVPTPPTVTPTPVSFVPARDWTPYVGWTPPEGWRPPTGWVPAGGWNVPPGWSAPAEWVSRLYAYGWKYIPGRGWTIPEGWTQPADFVVPPGWYYLPRTSYAQYGITDPSQVTIVPGRARTATWTVDSATAYSPSETPVTLGTVPPARPVPSALPQVTAIESREQVISALTRERTTERYQGPVLVTDAIHFDYDSYAIKPESFKTLDAIGDALVNPPLDSAIINIEGHTDADGSDEYNQQLSEKRAWSVKSYLVQKFGLDPNRLVIVGYSEQAPVTANTTDTAKALNRRVEFENVTGLYEPKVTQVETITRQTTRQ